MQIFVRTLRGSTLALEAEGTVEDAKRIIAEREGELFLRLTPLLFGRNCAVAASLVHGAPCAGPQSSGSAGKGDAERATASALKNYG
jgi:hypothetical protein